MSLHCSPDKVDFFLLIKTIYLVIESSFDPGEQLQAPGSLWLLKSEQFS
jgi:hypothetical protein